MPAVLRCRQCDCFPALEKLDAFMTEGNFMFSAIRIFDP